MSGERPLGCGSAQDAVNGRGRRVLAPFSRVRLICVTGSGGAGERAEPWPVVALNRVVAMRDGPAAGLALMDSFRARGELADYHLAPAARADLCRCLGRTTDARVSYERALGLTRQEPERPFIEARLRERDRHASKNEVVAMSI